MITLSEILPILSLLGVGGVIGAFFSSIWERNKTISLQKQEYKETRYKAILVLMYVYSEYETQSGFIRVQRPDINSKEKLFSELKAEWNNMILFASDEVLLKSHEFLKNPNQEIYKQVAIAMRKDLWGGKINQNIEKLSFENIVTNERA